MTSAASGSEWAGDMLDRPEMVAAFASQLRRVLSDQAEYVARIRRDAEAMWRANPPEGYGSFEAWWRHRWVTGPFGEIQAHIEKAATLTFKLEARYRRGRHEVPAARQAKQQLPPLQPLQRRDAIGREAGQERRAEEAASPDGNFLDLIRGDGHRKWSA